MQEYLRPVPDDGAGSTADVPTEPPAPPTGNSERSTPRPRAGRSLPTDRMKNDVQIQTLRAWAIRSNFGRDAIGADAIGSVLPVSSGTAGLNNNFFTDSGLLIRTGKGQFRPTDITCQFARKYDFDKVEAGKLLAPALRDTWYFEAVRTRLAMGPATVAQMVETLAFEGGATRDHSVQLGNILDWLAFAGLVTVTDGNVTLTDSAVPIPAPASPAAPESSSAAVEGAGATVLSEPPKPAAPEMLLGFAFDFHLTVEDLAKLSPEQITALFEAVGKVMAIKGSLAI